MKTNETSNPLGKTWDEIEQSRSTREQALAWWNRWSLTIKDQFSEKHFNMRPALTLTGREIEMIWLKETQSISMEKQADLIESEFYKEKSNQKQFKQFDESLFKSYIDKFLDEDKLKALSCLYMEIPSQLRRSWELGK